MNNKNQEEFENLLEIDKTRLDDECENQPRLVWNYGRLFAEAVRDLDKANSEVKLVEAKMDKAIRESPDKYGLDKVTEEGVKKAITRSRKMRKAITTQIECKYRVALVSAANQALDHRRTSLSMLDGQDNRNYFVRPSQQERKDRGRSAIRKTLRRGGNETE